MWLAIQFVTSGVTCPIARCHTVCDIGSIRTRRTRQMMEMKMAQHTPGPWQVGPVDDTVVTHLGADGTRYEVAAIDGDYNEPDQWPVMEANARLIAAAPDLLAALVALEGYLRATPHHNVMEAAAARAVIAKIAA